MKKIKLVSMFLIFSLISCDKKNNIENIFVTPKDYYWQYSDTRDYSIGCGMINFRFDKQGFSHKYDFSVKKGYILNEGLQGSDIEIIAKKWLLKNDSTFVWDGVIYKIEHIDNTVIVLLHSTPKDNKNPYWIRLLKVVGEK